MDLPETRVFGGWDADILDFPFMVSIHKDGRYLCGGSIITLQFILTAAHCLEDYSKNLMVRAGSNFQYEDGQVGHVGCFKIHEKYSPYFFDYDIAILKLVRKLVQGQRVAPVRLVQGNVTFAPGSQCDVTGWGHRLLNIKSGNVKASTRLDHLRRVEVPLYSHAACVKAWPKSLITPRMLCAGGEFERDACAGDSGGPLITSGVQIGIVSFGNNCGWQGEPAVYTNVATLIPWIQQSAKELRNILT